MVSSELHKVAKLDLDDLNFVKSYDGDRVYCSSKLANVLISNELARKLKGTGILFKISFISYYHNWDSVRRRAFSFLVIIENYFDTR